MITIGPVITKEGQKGYLDEIFCAYMKNCVCPEPKQKEACKNVWGIVYHTHPGQGAGYAYELNQLDEIDRWEVEDAVYLRK